MTSQASYRIMLVDDHPLYRDGLANLINNEPNLEVVDHAPSAQDGVEKYRQHRPDLIISDLSFAESSGLSLIRQIRDIPSACPILVLSMHDESFWAEQVLQCGANGYLQKDAASDVVIDAIQRTAAGEIYLSNGMQQKLLRQLSGLGRNDSPLRALSKRELEIFQYMAQGMSSKEVAAELFISLKTVQTHQSNMKTKLELKTLKELRELASSHARNPIPSVT